MAWFRRRPDPFVLVDVLDSGRTPAEEQADQHMTLRRIAAEAVILQDEAEAVIAGIRARQSLGYLAPRARAGGPPVPPRSAHRPGRLDEVYAELAAI